MSRFLVFLKRFDFLYYIYSVHTLFSVFVTTSLSAARAFCEHDLELGLAEVSARLHLLPRAFLHKLRSAIQRDAFLQFEHSYQEHTNIETHRLLGRCANRKGKYVHVSCPHTDR